MLWLKIKTIFTRGHQMLVKYYTFGAPSVKYFSILQRNKQLPSRSINRHTHIQTKYKMVVVVDILSFDDNPRYDLRVKDTRDGDTRIEISSGNYMFT